MIFLRIVAAVLVPVGVGLAYAPLHEGWMVQAFGCACMGSWFNANAFSLVVHGGVAGTAGYWLVRASTRLPLRPRMNAVALGMIAIGLESLYFWQGDRVI